MTRRRTASRAAYWHASWSGRGLEPFDSFYDVMYGQYTSFHALRN